MRKLRKKRGLACCMTGVMLLWNYYITPLYLETPREVVAGMLIPIFLPFNLIKGALNAAGTMLIYKPVSQGLRKAGLISASVNPAGEKRKGISIGTAICSVFIIICLVMLCFVIW